jgi:two-component system chemotaxis response regulator CheY
MSINLLIVEDCELTTELITELLNTHHSAPNILTAANGTQGLTRLAENRVDLIISDVMMPEMDGIGFVTEVRKIPEHANTPVIMLTSVSGIKEMQKGKIAGANSWLTKPLDPERLYELIDKYTQA